MTDTIQLYLETERKVINLMLRFREVIGELDDENINPLFFDLRHRSLVQAIFYTYRLSDGKRLLTDEHYRKLLIDQGSKGDITVAMQIYHECLYGIPHSNTKEDLDLLKKELINAYVHREGVEALHRLNNNVIQMGYLDATKQYIEELQSVVNLTEVQKSIFLNIDELQNVFIERLEKKRENKEERITCGITEIDEAMNVGFKAGHTSLFIAPTGGHKCLASYESCCLEDGSRITAEELYYRSQEEHLKILSYNEQSGSLYYQPVKQVISNGYQTCLRITTSLGFSIDVTENHPFLQLDGYKEALTLEVGDYVGLASHYTFGCKDAGLDLVFWLGCMYSGGETSQPLYTFTNQDEVLVDMMRASSRALKGELKLKRMGNELIPGNYYITGLREIGKKYNLDGYKASDKSLHCEIFQWNKSCLKDFLRAMFTCGGCFCCTQETRKNGSIQTKCSIVYISSSMQLAKDVRDLLMKFGLVAKFDSIFVEHEGKKQQNWQVKLRDNGQVRKFVEEIGFYGKKQVFAKDAISKLRVSSDRNKDLIPATIWELIDKKFVLYGKTYDSYRRVKEERIVAKRGASVNRDSLVELSKYLNNDKQLLQLATRDVVWDKIINVERLAVTATYDIAMLTHHNFVANGFITHNTNIMLNIALNIYKKGHSVLFVPLEMDWEDFVCRLISNVADVSYTHLLNPGQITKDEMVSIKKASVWLKNNNRFSILDVDEQISVSVLRNEIEKRKNFFSPKIVVVDYLGLMRTERITGNRHDLSLGDLSKTLKFMGKKYGFHIITAAQMGRADIRRLREEGADATFDSTAVKDSQEVSSHAEFIFALTKIPDESDRLRLHIVKSRYGGAGFTENLGLIADRCRITSVAMQMSSLGNDDLEDFVDHFEKHTEEEAEKALQELQWPEINLDDIDTTGA